MALSVRLNIKNLLRVCVAKIHETSAGVKSRRLRRASPPLAAWRGRELRSIIRIDRRSAVRLRSSPEVRSMANAPNRTIATKTSPPAEERFWQAVETRAADYDGVFYYGVRTTGVYCRPSCPSRRPKRENVLFFALPEAARQAGFRACLRCRPDEAVIRDPQAELTQSLCRLIEDRKSTRLNSSH